MRGSGDLEQVKATLDNWLKSKDYPKDFLDFFLRWTLLNLYYNATSEEEKEPLRVLEFGRRTETIFKHLELTAIALVRTECVGKGRYDAPPISWVKTASSQLRKRLGVNQDTVCLSCREHKRQMCAEVKLESYTFGNMEALMRILYQIRCNLFHGDKTEYKDGEQAERNKMLVGLGNEALNIVLKSIVQNQ